MKRNCGEKRGKGMENGERIIERHETKDDEDVSSKEENSFSVAPSATWHGWKAVAYSISRPSQRCRPIFVPGSITHVPRFSAKVSIIHRYKVGRAIGSIVFDDGSSKMNWWARLLYLNEYQRNSMGVGKTYQSSRMNGPAHTRINPM